MFKLEKLELVGRAFLKFLVVAGGGLVVGLVYGFIGKLNQLVNLYLRFK